jgi:hypothetical protein
MSGLSVKSILASRLAFCAGIALLMVLLRLVVFDFPVYFQTEFVPNHDMYQGAPFFATSMHSVRLSGEIAWWNPVSNNGYAQYYQSFFSPLAPTSHHLVFILWAQLVRVLGLLRINLPEYFQFLIVTYIIFPFLACLSFSLFVSQIFRRRATVFLILVVYTFSGIGLWNSAWFFFQEPFTLFLLLAAIVAALRNPGPRRLLCLLAALLIQLTSINYWTVYNSWFACLLLAAYCWAYPNQGRRLLVRTRDTIREHKTAAVIVVVMCALVLCVWFVMIGSIVVEQSGNYVGNFTGEAGAYTTADAFDRVKETRRFTTELFNPEVRRAIYSYKIENEMHNARYIGAFLLPLLVLIPVCHWRRRERWLILTAAGVLAVCMAPPFLLSAWKATPFMDRIRHLFYFYTHYWQLLIVLLAGASMDVLLERAYDRVVRRRFLYLISGLSVVLLLLLAGYLSFSHLFPAGDYTLQANLRFALLALVSSAVVLQLLLFPTKKNRQVFVLVICLLALTDLTRYFWEVSRADRSFTETRWPVRSPLPQEVRAALRRPWGEPVLSNGFKADLFGNMPVSNLFWNDNSWMNHRYVLELRELPEDFQKQELHGAPLSFYTKVETIRQPAQASEALKANTEAFINHHVLLLQPDAGQGVGSEKTETRADNPLAYEAQPVAEDQGDAGFAYQWREWRYNDFGFEVDAPRDGWLLIRQLDDPLWHLMVDGQRVRAVRANFVGMALPLKAGRHSIRMSYRPLARGLFWPGALALEIALSALALISVLHKREERRIRAQRNE